MGGAVFLSSFKGPFGHVLKPILGFFFPYFQVFKGRPFKQGALIFQFLESPLGLFSNPFWVFFKFFKVAPEWGAHIFHFPIVIGSLPSNFEL